MLTKYMVRVVSYEVFVRVSMLCPFIVDVLAYVRILVTRTRDSGRYGYRKCSADGDRSRCLKSWLDDVSYDVTDTLECAESYWKGDDRHERCVFGQLNFGDWLLFALTSSLSLSLFLSFPGPLSLTLPLSLSDTQSLFLSFSLSHSLSHFFSPSLCLSISCPSFSFPCPSSTFRRARTGI